MFRYSPLFLMLVASFTGSLLLTDPADADTEPTTDVWQSALEAMGITEEDLGYRPKASWARYPHPRTIPHVLPFFEDLLAHPLDTYEFTRTLGNAVEDLLTPEQLTRIPEGSDRAETLFKLSVTLGTDRRIGGFRGYSANLDPQVQESDPLLHALVTLLERADKPLQRPKSFGSTYEDDEPMPIDRLRDSVSEIPESLRPPLARLVLNLIEAREWIDLGLRKITPTMRDDVFAAFVQLIEETPDGTGYYPIFDDVAGLIDEHSLHYGCLKAMQATQDARRELGTLPDREKNGRGKQIPGFYFEMQTPWGQLIFDNDSEASRVGTGGSQRNSSIREPFQPPLLFVSFGARDHIPGPIGSTTSKLPLSVALILDEAHTIGADSNTDLQIAGGAADLAAGILGCGIVYSAGSFHNRYLTGDWGLGAGLFGWGALIDEGGNDFYSLASVGMGTGFWGTGLLLDAAGDDEYRLLEGDGQGCGGSGGIGVLADRSGDDLYYAEPDAELAGRADYHSKKAVAANNAQGVGAGRRGDGSDGHSWAGGLGALLDVDGNDRYVAGNFTQGLGYWYGTGLLWDGGGNDEYESVYFTQGSGAHFAIGALIDESGDDRHILKENAGAALAFGWDVVNAFLIDRGNGNDHYDAKIISIGLAEVRSNAFFIDEGGDDVYTLDAGQLGFGDVDERESYQIPRRTTTFPFHLGQVGVFLDLGGTDRYEWRNVDGATKEQGDSAESPPLGLPEHGPGDNRTWNVRPRISGTSAGPNVSYGGDFERGSVDFLSAWPARTQPPE